MVVDLELNPLFHDIDGKYLDLLRPLFERVSFPTGTTVIKQGEKADYIYLIESGVVAITYKPYDDDPITITHVKLADCSGGLHWWEVRSTLHRASPPKSLMQFVCTGTIFVNYA